MLVENIGHNVVLTQKERNTMLLAKADDRQIAIFNLADNIMAKYGDDYTGTPEYGDVLIEIVSALYEELLSDIEIIEHSSLPMNDIINKI